MLIFLSGNPEVFPRFVDNSVEILHLFVDKLVDMLITLGYCLPESRDFAPFSNTSCNFVYSSYF